MSLRAGTAWLSVTPEPERDLPPAIAALRAGGTPSPVAVTQERARAERLVLRGSRRRWMRWMAEARALAERSAPDPAPTVAAASEVALDVIENHHALLLGLPGRLDRSAEHDRRRLSARRRAPHLAEGER